MLRDASHRQAIQKFSFIESLNLSRIDRAYSRSSLGKVNTDRAFCFQQRQQSLPSASLRAESSGGSLSQTGAMVTSSEATATIDRHWYEATPDYSLSLAEIIKTSSESNYLASEIDSHSSSTATKIGKIVFALACSYGLFVSYWLFGDQGSKVLNLISGGKQIVLSKSEVEFLDYMERSLVQIDRERVAKKEKEGDVVYVPVYTPSSKVSNNAPSTLTRSNPVPQAVPPAPLAIPAPPPLPSPAPINNSIQTTEIASKPQINHVLIGVLELGGDRSAALVKVRGKTRRVWLGEKIHSDGWILQSVGNQEATIEHQGQVRSISVGETF
ncbi:MAG: hypothetical protein AAFO95_04485 [Cyanobacteria bacterium J06600_6]